MKWVSKLIMVAEEKRGGEIVEVKWQVILCDFHEGHVVASGIHKDPGKAFVKALAVALFDKASESDEE